MKRRLPPCTHCGAQHDDTKPTLTWLANDGEIPGWDLRCGWCKKTFRAAMLPLPPETSPSALDESLRVRRRNEKRSRFGWQPGDPYTSRGAKRLDSDRILATIKIQNGRVVAGLRKRLRHIPLTRELEIS